MTGDDFLRLAGNLVASPGSNPEAKFRSAVSRAYYGVFHWSIKVLGEFGVRVPGNAQGHDFAKEQLRLSEIPDAMQAASLMSDLRGDRNEADYRLDRPRFARQVNAKLCVESATDAITLLKNCLQEPVRADMEDYFRANPPPHWAS